MKYQQKLLLAWRSRTGPVGTEQFSEHARQRISTLFLMVSEFEVDRQAQGAKKSGLQEPSMELVELGIEEKLSIHVFCAELRNCQLSLLDVLTSNALGDGQQQLARDHQKALRSLARLLADLDGLITQSAEKFTQSADTPSGSTSTPGNTGKQGKTLQHEIRTPLQGALLTTELMLEDAGQGDPVSIEDILAVRKSIETAVGILNDFASRSGIE